MFYRMWLQYWLNILITYDDAIAMVCHNAGKIDSIPSIAGV